MTGTGATPGKTRGDQHWTGFLNLVDDQIFTTTYEYQPRSGTMDHFMKRPVLAFVKLHRRGLQSQNCPAMAMKLYPKRMPGG